MRIAILLAALAFPVATAAGQRGQPARPATPDTLSTLVVPEGALHFLAIGDWGRHGQHGQRETAASLGRVAQRVDAEFILSLGDHFYPNGVQSVQDENFRRSFEDVYTDHSLYVDWYPVLGNHEYRGNPQAVIDYASLTRRWRGPARYYAVEKTLDDGTRLLLLFLDTTPLIRSYWAEPEKYAVTGQDTVAQRVWLDSALTASSAEWKLIVGHHQVYSGGKRTTLTELEALLLPRMQRHGVQAYLAGHEHDLQHIVRHGKHFIVSGAGSELRPTGTTEGTRFSASVNGFVVLSLERDRLLVQAVGTDDRVLYRSAVPR